MRTKAGAVQAIEIQSGRPEVLQHRRIFDLGAEGAEIQRDVVVDVFTKEILMRLVPILVYILKEAQVRGNGERLGPVGARLVAEVFVGLVQGDKDSFMSQPGWTPTLPAKTPGTFFMTDLLQFVGRFVQEYRPARRDLACEDRVVCGDPTPMEVHHARTSGPARDEFVPGE